MVFDLQTGIPHYSYGMTDNRFILKPLVKLDIYYFAIANAREDLTD